MVAEPIRRPPLETSVPDEAGRADRAGRAGRAERAGHPARRRPLLRPVADRRTPLRLLAEEEIADLLDGFRTLLPLPERMEPSLRAVLADLLEHPGSLARAQLAYGVMTDCCPGEHRDDGERRWLHEQARRLAIAVEYFHSASLVFDDMPSMDDARERRGRPCPHRTHGEASATLGALALITRAYALLWEVLGGLDGPRRARAGALVDECLGAAGILDGQARDLRFDPGRHQAAGADVVRVAEGKTVPLIRLSLVLPALAGGASEAALDRLEELSYAWGLAYQILDDFKDGLMSRRETGKSTARDGVLGRPNLPAAIGPRAAMERLEELSDAARAALDGLATAGEQTDPTGRLGRLQAFLDGERLRVAARLRLG